MRHSGYVALAWIWVSVAPSMAGAAPVETALPRGSVAVVEDGRIYICRPIPLSAALADQRPFMVDAVEYAKSQQTSLAGVSTSPVVRTTKEGVMIAVNGTLHREPRVTESTCYEITLK
jgi:hypothetical protein